MGFLIDRYKSIQRLEGIGRALGPTRRGRRQHAAGPIRVADVIKVSHIDGAGTSARLCNESVRTFERTPAAHQGKQKALIKHCC